MCLKQTLLCGVFGDLLAILLRIILVICCSQITSLLYVLLVKEELRILGLLHACRVVGALSVCCDWRLSVSWLASEVNPADEPSRRFQPRRVIQDGVPHSRPATTNGPDGEEDGRRRAGVLLRPGRRQAAAVAFGTPPGLGGFETRGLPSLRLRGAGSRGGKQLPAPSMVANLPLGLVPRLSALAAKKVRVHTQLLYLEALRELLTWGLWRSLPDWQGPMWDVFLDEYVAWLYENDRPSTVASRTLAAVLWAAPKLGSPIMAILPSAHRSLAGWTRLCPPTSRPPIPFCVMMLIGLELIAAGRPSFALMAWVLFETYMRPSEAFAMRVGQVIMPRAGAA